MAERSEGGVGGKDEHEKERQDVKINGRILRKKT